MLYTTFNVGEKEYKCRLNAKACVDLEKKMDGNPLNIFLRMNETHEMPKLQDIIYILHASLQAYQHGISVEDTYKIYDDFIDEGNSLNELIPIVFEIFKVSGFFNSEDNSKNA